MAKKPIALAFLWLSLVLTAGWATAQEPAAARADDAAAEPAWTGSIGLSYLATSGNSDSESFGVDLEATRDPEPWGLEVAAQLNRAEQDGVKTVERYQASLRGTRALAERWQAFVGLSAEQDEFAGIDLRGIVEIGAAYTALPGPRHSLILDFALTRTDEDRLTPEIDQDWLGGLAGASYELAISDNAGFSQTLRYYANFDDTGDWRADSVSALTAAINSRLALRLSHEIRYRDEPIGANDETDTTTKVSLVWKM
jgi:putative salt-induced outer membrane protein